MMIRSARTDDIPSLSAIERSSAHLFRGTAMEFAMDDPPLEQAILEKALNSETLWIAERKGERAGFLCASRLEDFLYIEELAVASSHQGFGLGRALLAHCIADAADHPAGFVGIALTTDRELPWNAPFYQTLGFEIVDAPAAALKAKLEEEIANGFDSQRRCAMWLGFG